MDRKQTDCDFYLSCEHPHYNSDRFNERNNHGIVLSAFPLLEILDIILKPSLPNSLPGLRFWLNTFQNSINLWGKRYFLKSSFIITYVRSLPNSPLRV